MTKGATTTTKPTRRAWPWLGAAALVATARLLRLRALGAADHVTVLVGMPRSDASWILGPLYVVASVLVPIAAPALAIAALADVGWVRWARRRRDSAVPIERRAP